MYGLNLLNNELPHTENHTKKTLTFISTRKYENALNLAIEAQSLISDYKSNATEELAKNNCYIYIIFFKLLEFLASYWKYLESEKYYESWCKLQDALDSLRQLKRFYKEENITVSFITKQLISLEKAYPYTHFSSCGFIVESFECSLCSQNIDSDECPHIKGQLYSGELAISIARKIKKLDHISIVTNPKNKRLVLAPDDTRQNFNLFRLLILEFNSKKTNPLNFAQVELTKTSRLNPSHYRAPRNSLCYCGTKKKYKHCCIRLERVKNVHMNILPGTLIHSGLV